MPRGPRLDAPGVLHHVMVRGLERRAIFRDDRDRRDFLGRVAALGRRGDYVASFVAFCELRLLPGRLRPDAPGVLHYSMVRGLERHARFRDDRARAALRRRLAALVAAADVTVSARAVLPNHVRRLVLTGKRSLARAMRSLLTGYAGAFNRRHRRRDQFCQNRSKSMVVEEEPFGLVPDLAALDRYPWSRHRAGRRCLPTNGPTPSSSLSVLSEPRGGQSRRPPNLALPLDPPPFWT